MPALYSTPKINILRIFILRRTKPRQILGGVSLARGHEHAFPPASPHHSINSPQEEPWRPTEPGDPVLPKRKRPPGCWRSEGNHIPLLYLSWFKLVSGNCDQMNHPSHAAPWNLHEVALESVWPASWETQRTRKDVQCDNKNR